VPAVELEPHPANTLVKRATKPMKIECERGENVATAAL
jgi:hypothetical protein